MPDPELLSRFRARLRYQQAQPWQKPWLDPCRFFGNQLRKRGFLCGPAGALTKTATFHLPDFTVVEGELVSQEIVSYGMFEPDLTEAFLHLVQPGQVVLDIGMHLGYYTTLLAVLVGPSGQVHAFEPTPSTREIAQHNLCRFAHVHVHPLAVWSSAGSIVLRDYGLKFMGFNTVAKAKLDQEPVAPKEVQVQTITLDAFRASLAKDARVALVKIDAESAERAIIAGGKELLRQHQPLISVEVGDQRESHESRALTEDLLALEYAPWEFRNGRFQRHQKQNTYAYGNLIFAPTSIKLEKLS
jgi:FkbM family methyltransferase